MTDPLQLMIKALDLEVASIRKKGAGTQVELRGGELVGRAESSWLYRFLVAEDLSLRDETPIRVTVGQDDVSGVLVSFRAGVLLVALEEDLGAKIASARLLANDSFLVERLKERLEKVQAGEAEFDRSAANRVLGLATPRDTEAEPDPAVLADGRVNKDQEGAIRRSLGSDTTFVWGPPGTGKTTTIARIVEAHYRAGRSVLLVSNTNIAVDTALERLAERLVGEPDFHQGAVIRQGPVVKEELRTRFGPQIILEEIVARLGEALRLEKDELAREAGPIEDEERTLSTALTDHEHLASIRATLAARHKATKDSQVDLDARMAEAATQQGTSARLHAALERARTMGTVRRILTGQNPERLQREIASSESSARAAKDAATALETQLRGMEAETRALSSEAEGLSAKVGRHPAEGQIRDRLSLMRERLNDIRERLSSIDHELAELERQVIERCRVLATTVYRTYLGKGPMRRFDVVVIDEASMLMPPLAYYAAGLAKLAVTVAGDFRQLPPIVISDEPLAEEWLRRDVFEKAGIPQRLERREPTPGLVVLGTQYRMREPICAVINKLFYPDQPLRTDPSVNRVGRRFPLAAAPLLYVDTAPFHPWAALRVGTYTRYNLFHALLVRNIVLHLAETGYLPRESEANDSIGAVAPYAAQARLIQALLDDRLGPRAAGIASSVHRFQGNEKATMVIDLTDSLGAPLGRFLKATHLAEDGARLLNVAASRAKDHVVLLGNFEYLRSKAPPGGFLHRLLDQFEEHGEALPLETLLPLAERDWIDGLHTVLPTNFEFAESAAGAFTEGTFYPAFLKDLGRVSESLVIFSPFVTGVGTGRWVDLIRAALRRGVHVRVLTRPPNEPGGGGAEEVETMIQALRELGVTVDLRKRMHEKIAMLDGRVLWHGSLNILSHRDTHESMLRIESRAACEQLGRFMSTPTGLRGDAQALDAPENPACPSCGGPTVWNDGRYGIYYECEDRSCSGKVDARRRSGQQMARGVARRTDAERRPRQETNKFRTAHRCPELGCGGTLVQRNGRYGRFLGCTNYPKCRHTENLR